LASLETDLCALPPPPALAYDPLASLPGVLAPLAHVDIGLSWPPGANVDTVGGAAVPEGVGMMAWRAAT
jgi:hypothetical protein